MCNKILIDSIIINNLFTPPLPHKRYPLPPKSGNFLGRGLSLIGVEGKNIVEIIVL